MAVGTLKQVNDKFYYVTNLVAAGNSDIIIISSNQGSPRPGFVMVGVTASSGATGKAQYSCSDPRILDGSVVGTDVWHDWLTGSVASGAEKYAIEGRVMTGIRFVQTGAGAVTGEISF